MTLALLLVAAGCNTTGTCLVEPPGDVLERDPAAAYCVVNEDRRSCKDRRHAEFFEEDDAVGLLRCKLAGYESSKAAHGRKDAEKLERGEAIRMFRRERTRR